MVRFTKPITLLTGFLGSGKTTFLNQWLKQKQGTRIAIIENELGKESPDGFLIEKGDEDILEINSGCFCCSGQNKLMSLLEQLADRQTEFDEIIIELTGIANPLQLIEQLTRHPLLREHFPLQKVICIIDSEAITCWSEANPELISQLVASDIWVWNRCTNLTSEERIAQQSHFAMLNPLASHHYVEGKKFPVSAIEDAGVDGGIPTISAAESQYRQLKKHDIKALHFKYSGFFQIDMLYYRLFQLMVVQSGDLLRIKAVLNKPDETHRIILQGAGRHVYMDAGPPWEADEPRTNTLLLIGKHLNQENFDKLFKKYLNVAESAST